MFRALLFDFDGVLADTEPIHFQMFNEVLEGEGIRLTEEEYSTKYLGLDDRGCFQAVFQDRGLSLTPEKEEGLLQAKHLQLWRFVQGKQLLYPGVKETLEALRGRYYLGIVSGSLKNEIEAILNAAHVFSCFQLMVTAEDVSQGKPSPEGYIQAISRIQRDLVPSSEILLPEECLAIEDSPWGIQAAKKAGARCLAVTTSYPAESLKEADWIFSGVGGLKPHLLKDLS